MINKYRGLFRTNWKPEQFLAIDESIIAYKGKFCPCRIYMPDKPVKFGIKVYKLCNDLGITLDFWPYGGKNSTFPGEPCWMKPYNCGERIVMNFVHSNFLAPGSVITGDRHFSSPTLAAILPDTFGVYYNGTCMPNRLYFPGYKLNNYNASQTERGYYSFAYNERYKVICTSWLDRDPVNFVSSAFGALPSYVVRGYKPEDKEYEQYKFPAPEMSTMYNHHMGNVDKSNFYAYLEHYSMSATMQCKKWWKRLNNGLFDIARTNAMVAWTQARKGRNHGMFIDTLIEQYVNNRLDEGYSWEEMRTGCPAPEKGITRISAAARKQIVDKLIAGKKIKPAMLKECSLEQVKDLSVRASHDPILYEDSAAYKTTIAVHGDKRGKKKDKPMNRLVVCSMQVTSQSLGNKKYCLCSVPIFQNSQTLPILFGRRQKGD